MQKLKKLFSKTQEGRSMVEMLGVLAIIGVLSIGGIAGFNMAMRKYRKNELVDPINKMFVLSQIKSLNFNGTDIGFNFEEAFGKTPQEGLPNVIANGGFFSAGILSNEGNPCLYVTFSKLTDLKICDALEDALSDDYSVVYCNGDDEYNEAYIVNKECVE